jgi:hypothetical protein
MPSNKRNNPKIIRCDQCSFTAEHHKTELSRDKAKKREKGEHT